MKSMGMALIIPVLVFGMIGCGGENSSSSEVLVCFGDSLTEGYGASTPGSVDKSKSYPAFLQSKLAMQIVNSGISGDTAEEALMRMEKDVLSKNPRVVIILLGANDFFRQRPAAETKSDLQSIINKLKTENRKIFLASFIGNAGWEDTIFGAVPGLQFTGIDALLTGYKKIFSELIAENSDVGFISDIWTGVWGLNMSDPIHPNAAGYSIMADTIFNAIKPYLQENNLL